VLGKSLGTWHNISEQHCAAQHSCVLCVDHLQTSNMILLLCIPLCCTWLLICCRCVLYMTSRQAEASASPEATRGTYEHYRTLPMMLPGTASQKAVSMCVSQPRMSLHGGWEKARRQGVIDRLLAAGPLSTAIRIGTNHVSRSKCKAAGRLRLDRVTVAAIFPLHQTVCRAPHDPPSAAVKVVLAWCAVLIRSCMAGLGHVPNCLPRTVPKGVSIPLMTSVASYICCTCCGRRSRQTAPCATYRLVT